MIGTSKHFIALLLTLAAPAIAAQSPAPSRADSLRLAERFDTDGEYAKARSILQRLIDGAPTPALKADAQHALAISYAFTRECASAAILEQKIIAYWKTREHDQPQNAAYQQGESAREAGDICFDAGDYDAAERSYRQAAVFGVLEPEPRAHPRALWAFRLASDLAKVNAKRGNRAEADRLGAEARRILAGDKRLAAQQERYLPFLDAVVMLALRENAEPMLRKTIAMRADQDTVYAYLFLALGPSQRPEYGNREDCARAYARATAHDVASAYVRPIAKACMLGRRPPFDTVLPAKRP